MEIVLQTEDKSVKDTFDKLIPKVNKQNPKPEDLQTLKKMMDEHPELWQKAVSVAQAVEHKMIENWMPGAAIYAEITRHKIREQRELLGWENASEIERLLIRQISLSYLARHLNELKKNDLTSKGCSFREAVYWEKITDCSQKRYLRSIETLAKVQMLTARTQEIEARAHLASSSNALKSANLLKALTA